MKESFSDGVGTVLLPYKDMSQRSIWDESLPPSSSPQKPERLEAPRIVEADRKQLLLRTVDLESLLDSPRIY